MLYLCVIYVLRSCDYSSNVPSHVKTRKPRAVAHSQRKDQWTEVTGDLPTGSMAHTARNDATQFKRMEDGYTISHSATKVEDTRVTFVVCLNFAPTSTSAAR